VTLLQFFSTMSRFSIYPRQKMSFCFGSQKTGAKNWLIFQKYHYCSDIWPQLKLNRCQKLFSTSVKIEPRPNIVFCLKWNCTDVKNCFMPLLKIEPRPKGSLRFKNRESLFFFFFLACAFSLLATHLHCCCCALTTCNYLKFGSFMF